MIFRHLLLFLVAAITLAGCEIKKNDEQVIFHELPGGTIQDMAIDGNGDIWFITSQNIWAVIDSGPDNRHKLYKFDGSTWLTIKTMPVNNPISDIEVDASNRIWVSTYNEGYFIIEN